MVVGSGIGILPTSSIYFEELEEDHFLYRSRCYLFFCAIDINGFVYFLIHLHSSSLVEDHWIIISISFILYQTTGPR